MTIPHWAHGTTAIGLPGSAVISTQQGVITGSTFTFYADAGNRPRTVLALYYDAGNFGETFVRFEQFGDPMYAYSWTLAVRFAASAGTEYWASIVPGRGFPPQGAEEQAPALTPSPGNAASVPVKRSRSQPSSMAFRKPPLKGASRFWRHPPFRPRFRSDVDGPSFVA